MVAHPGPDDLPDFARAFDVQLCCRRGEQGVLVAAFGHRGGLAADPRVSRYAEVTGVQPGWRLDLAILGTEPPRPDPAVGNAHDLSADQIEVSATKAEDAATNGFTQEGLVVAWGTLEAAARLHMRAQGEPVKWSKPWRELASALYANDVISPNEFDRLLDVYQTRNRVAHGLAEATVDSDDVHFVARLARRISRNSELRVPVTA